MHYLLLSLKYYTKTVIQLTSKNWKIWRFFPNLGACLDERSSNLLERILKKSFFYRPYMGHYKICKDRHFSSCPTRPTPVPWWRHHTWNRVFFQAQFIWMLYDQVLFDFLVTGHLPVISHLTCTVQRSDVRCVWVGWDILLWPSSPLGLFFTLVRQQKASFCVSQTGENNSRREKKVLSSFSHLFFQEDSVHKSRLRPEGSHTRKTTFRADWKLWWWWCAERGDMCIFLQICPLGAGLLKIARRD